MPDYSYRCKDCGAVTQIQSERGKAPRITDCQCGGSALRVVAGTQSMVERMPQEPTAQEKKRAAVKETNKRLSELEDQKRVKNFKHLRSELTGGEL